MIRFWRLVALAAVAAFLPAVSPSSAAADDDATAPPNVLFISIDDLNDWVGPFGGHPQAKTPHLDRFAAEGAVVFQNAHCPGPVCGPSRSALLSGMMPYRTGIYGNAQNMLASKLVQTHATLPEYFAKAGYQTICQGKIFHAHVSATGRDQGHWAFTDWTPAPRGMPVDPEHLTSRTKNVIDGKPAPKSKFSGSFGSEFSWGPTLGDVTETKDHQVATWAAEQLQQSRDQPFFLAVGLSRPHLPFYVPQEFFDMHPVDQIELPPIREDDLDDILNLNGKPLYTPTADYRWLKQHGQLKHAAQAYLAASSYADACLGLIFESLRTSPHADNTIVIVWGDHGWHLGEKMRYRKATVWSESTRLPLMIRTPDHQERMDCNSLVNLIDLYPTLIEYCGLPEKEGLDGVSIAPLLRNPEAKVREFTRTICGENETSLTDGDWRYIRHRNGAEQLYDLRNDPQEWTNLARSTDPDIVANRKRLADLVPAKFATPIVSSPKNVKQRIKGMDPTLKARRNLAALK